MHGFKTLWNSMQAFILHYPHRFILYVISTMANLFNGVENDMDNLFLFYLN